MELIHKQIIKNCDTVCTWFDQQLPTLPLPIYASFDVRDSGKIVAPVDANIFPAGFNNICPVDKENAPPIFKKYLDAHYPNVGPTVGLLAEEHTGNAYYWQNVMTIKTLLEQSGRQVTVCWPREMHEPVVVRTANGEELTVYEARIEAGGTFANGHKLDLIICNNDFSNSYADWSTQLKTPINPPFTLGWYRRRKHDFFKQYNSLVSEFAKIIDVPAAHMTVETVLFEKFDIYDPDNIESLAQNVDQFIAKMNERYAGLGIQDKPFCFVKNNTGTYGLAVTQVHSGDEVREWNNKARKKMQAAKGGREVSELIIQEGIPTIYRDNGGSAEPCIYTVGGELVGGFLRAHAAKGPDESLNSPGAVYKRLCMSDLLVDRQDCPMENVYGWVAKLGLLAIAKEAKANNVEFVGYT